MDFLEKLDLMMSRYNLNKRTLSIKSDIPYTTIDNWYKRGYDGLKLSTLRKLSEYFNTLLDFWIKDDVTDPNYGKSSGFEVEFGEMERIKKYRLLDPYGKEAVDGVLDVEYRRCEEARRVRVAKAVSQREKIETKEISPEAYCYIVPAFSSPMSAGTGTLAEEDEYPEDFRLRKAPPRGTSYIAPVNGESMEPDYYSGDWVFVHATNEIPIGSIGVFFMDGDLFIKERGKGVLISHNPDYEPRKMDESIRCQGLVLGVCDESYFE